MAVLLYGSVPIGHLLGWAVPLLLLILFRLYNLSRFPSDTKGSASRHREAWYRHFKIYAYLTALGLGLAAPLFLPYLDQRYLHFLLLFFIIGISAGALAALFPDLQLVTTYLLLINLPLFVYLLTRDEPYAGITAATLFVLIIVLHAIAGISRDLMFQNAQRQVKLQVKERELHALFEQTPTPIFYFDTDMRVRKYNRAFKEFFHVSDDEELDGFDLHSLSHYPAIQLMKEVLENQEPRKYDGYYHSTFPPERRYWIRAIVAPLFNDRGELIGGVSSFQDKTLEKESIDNLQRLASKDSLTGLHNRRVFFQRLSQLLQETRRRLTLLLFLDLDQFKPINDTLGHNIGDKVLQKVADILREILPKNAQAFRLGGDEFVLLFPDCGEKEAAVRQYAETFAEQLNRRLNLSIVLDGYHLPIRASIGAIVIYPHMQDSDEIIRRADIAMYQAKSSSGHLAFYDPSLDMKRQKNFFLRHGLSNEKLTDQLRLEYQPIVAYETGFLLGAEALIRWKHPSLGLLSPEEFIPLAVESGEILKIGRWVAEEVCKTLALIQKSFPRTTLRYLSYNIDAHELHFEDFADYLSSLLDRYRLPPKSLVAEITENSLIDNLPHIEETIHKLKKLGVLCAIDDFGIGYSSLSYLQRLTFDILKIDQSFARVLTEKDRSVFLIGHILQIARQLNYTVVVEGIEDDRQLQKLKGIFPGLQCQGFYYSKPLSKEAFFKLLEHPQELGRKKPD